MNRKKFKFNPNPKPFRPRPMNKPFKPYRARPPTRPEKPEPEPEIDEHYWSVEEWEDWAEEQYLNNEDAQLPEWFIKKMEEEE